VFWTYHLYFSVVIILVLLYDKKNFDARIRIRRNDSKTFYLIEKDVKFSLFGGLLSHTVPLRYGYCSTVLGMIWYVRYIISYEELPVIRH
jgi:hypothetical protein